MGELIILMEVEDLGGCDVLVYTLVLFLISSQINRG